jgi:hypothetical protein
MVKILGKVENLVCRILRSFSTENENGFDVHDERGKCVSTILQLTSWPTSNNKMTKMSYYSPCELDFSRLLKYILAGLIYILAGLIYVIVGLIYISLIYAP